MVSQEGGGVLQRAGESGYASDVDAVERVRVYDAPGCPGVHYPRVGILICPDMEPRERRIRIAELRAIASLPP